MGIKCDINNSPSQERLSFLKNCKDYFEEYCNNTSIHGLKFIGDKRRTVTEKIFWLIFLSASIYICGILIWQVYRKWETSPVVVTFATTQTPIWNIPFPSVTICPVIKSDATRFNFTDKIIKNINNNLTDPKEIDELRNMKLVCTMISEGYGIIGGNEVTNESAIEFLLKVVPDFDTVLMRGTWRGKDLKYSTNELRKNFQPILTKEGVCYSFNLMDTNEIFTDIVQDYRNYGWINQNPSFWSLEKGYDRNTLADTFPRRTLMSGLHGGLDITLNSYFKNVDRLCSDGVQGYKIIINHPGIIPSANDGYFRVPLDQDVIAVIKPTIMRTSDNLKNYSPQSRQCYFNNERELQYFKTYNQQNCLLECLTNYTLHHCGCAAFYMPRDNLTLICSPSMQLCLIKAQSGYLTKELTHKLKNNIKYSSRKFRKTYPVPKDCNCLPSCNDISFEVETSQADWEWRKAIEVLDDINDTSYKAHISRLKVFFKDMQFITSERNQLYGVTDFWANCGGLLGLFIGFSFISLLEMLYFISLRLMCNIRKYGRRNWTGTL